MEAPALTFEDCLPEQFSEALPAVDPPFPVPLMDQSDSILRREAMLL